MRERVIFTHRSIIIMKISTSKRAPSRGGFKGVRNSEGHVPPNYSKLLACHQ